MAKYHMSVKGNPETCTATVRACPLGGAEDHYPTQKAAREAYEAKNEEQVAPAAKKVGVRLQNRAAKHTLAATLSQVPSTPTLEELKNASAYSVVNDRFLIAGYKEESYKEAFENFEDSDHDTDYVKVKAKEYIITSADGSFTKVLYVASVEAQDDGVTKYYPELEATYQHYSNLEQLEKNTPTKKDEVRIDTDSVLYEKTSYGDRESYDRYDGASAKEAATTAINTLSKPYEIARTAVLQNSSRKLPEKTLLSEKYFGNTDEQIRASVVARDEFPLSAHDSALQDKSIHVQNALAGRSDLTKETMEQILELDVGYTQGKYTSQYSNDSPRQNLLKNPKLPVRLMNKIANFGSVKDMKSLYRNPAKTDKVKKVLEARAQQLGVNIKSSF